MCLEALMHSGKFLEKNKNGHLYCIQRINVFQNKLMEAAVAYMFVLLHVPLFFNSKLPDEPNLLEILQVSLLETVKSIKYEL